MVWQIITIVVAALIFLSFSSWLAIYKRLVEKQIAMMDLMIQDHDRLTKQAQEQSAWKIPDGAQTFRSPASNN